MSANQDGEIELLRRIATRDRAAFQKLYERFARHAYNIALHLTREPALAEEAVQDGMLRVWRYAGTCHEQNPRAWMSRIVANESFRLLKKKTRGVPVRDDGVNSVPIEEESKDDLAEGHELHQALHRSIERLPDVTRQIVALYYGASLSQRKIAAMLQMPQTTISLKLREAIEQLRGSLAGAGFAGAATILGEGVLRDAFIRGNQSPLGDCRFNFTLGETAPII